MSEKLKPCPLCGAPAELNLYCGEGLVPNASVSCTNYLRCGASINFTWGIHDDDTENDKYVIEAVRRWNKRYKPRSRGKKWKKH